MVALPGDQLLTSDPTDPCTLVAHRAIPVTVVTQEIAGRPARSLALAPLTGVFRPRSVGEGPTPVD